MDDGKRTSVVEVGLLFHHASLFVGGPREGGVRDEVGFGQRVQRVLRPTADANFFRGVSLL